jgi:thioredoxin 1
MSQVQHVNTESFESQVLHSVEPVVVDFHATWCMPCKMLAPVLEKVAADFASRVKVVKVDVDEAPELAAKYQIQGVPTLKFFRAGGVVDTVVGLVPPRTLLSKLDALASAPSA